MAELDVWIVEDNPNFRKSIASLINNSPLLRCEHAFSTCEDALKAFQRGEVPSIVLLDIGLPKMNGIEGIAKFKALSPATQIIMLTMFEEEKNIFDALSAGATGYLLKSIAPEAVLQGIIDVANGGSAITPSIAKKILEYFTQVRLKNTEYNLSEREQELLRYFIEGYTKQQIAEKLYLSYHTVNTHIRNIYSKLHVNTRGELLAKAYKERLI